MSTAGLPALTPPDSNKIGQRMGLRGQRTRQRLLHAARELLATVSPMELTVFGIARRAHSSPATFYVYFTDVRELLLALSETAAATADEMLPRADSLLSDQQLAADVRTMIAAVNSAWDRNAAVLIYRNLEADRGDVMFERLRVRQVGPLLLRLSEAIQMRRPDTDEDVRHAEAAVLVAAVERIAVRLHRPTEDGPKPNLLERALADLLTSAIGRRLT